MILKKGAFEIAFRDRTGKRITNMPLCAHSVCDESDNVESLNKKWIGFDVWGWVGVRLLGLGIWNPIRERALWRIYVESRYPLLDLSI